MKTIRTYIAFAMLALVSATTPETQNYIQADNLFTVKDAEKVMGEKAHLKDSATKQKGQDPQYPDSMFNFKKEASTYHCGYTANAKDPKTGITGIVYFGFEQYADDSVAKKVYAFYKKSNLGAIGFRELTDLGDEAWFGSSPLFVYARKGDRIFIIKVNKMTSNTSAAEFNSAAKRIAAALQ